MQPNGPTWGDENQPFFGILQRYFTLFEAIPYLKGIPKKKCKVLLSWHEGCQYICEKTADAYCKGC